MDKVREYTAQLQNFGSRAIGYLNTDGLIPQLILTILIVIAIHVVIMMFESVVGAIQSYNRLSATVVKDTVNSEKIIYQAPDSSHPKLYPSNNELTGLEFSYSWHLYIDPENFGGLAAACPASGGSAESSSAGWGASRTVWYKGSDKPWPLLGPGVFLHPTENVMRIYMNAINNVKDSYVDIPNIPVGKWFHMVITQKGRFMDIYINGNVIKRHEFSAVPRINFGNVYVFPLTTVSADASSTGGFGVVGAMKGMLSRLNYYAYALNYAQIDDLYRSGPSSKVEVTTMDETPPYFHDSWWVTRY